MQFHFQLITVIMKNVLLKNQQFKVSSSPPSFENKHSAVATAVEVISSIFKAVIIFGQISERLLLLIIYRVFHDFRA